MERPIPAKPEASNGPFVAKKHPNLKAFSLQQGRGCRIFAGRRNAHFQPTATSRTAPRTRRS
ncbi:hypothetical protein SNOG_08148 [Parastagonospora nodorum SN15]|uniref:Uncharacterized protein n=1 Tax=Phaeosphaeria nodorum (strain SN15 / ATCC MYA-4574 / FGSC 10173) TaxID=321614 RepID=Q0UJB6_PHANO|nr:hypothetical protein SNOG_08148 [Parastagonospora nodorum SN15]EAT84424.1 hypothetical protein SNOG_08148 [Parastagonospora nodorum SN15]